MSNLRSNFANAFETTLSAEMGATDLLATVTTTVNGPSSPCYLVIEPDEPTRREYVLFDGTFTGTTFVTSSLSNRYLNGSAAGSGIVHPINSVVKQLTTKQMFDDLHDRVDHFRDHGNLTGLTDDDHTNYLTTGRHDLTSRHPVGSVVPVGTPGSSAVGDTAAEGSASTAARSDHRHAREAFGTPGSSAPGDSVTTGSSATLARSDHKHGREAWGSGFAQQVFDSSTSYSVVSAGVLVINETITLPSGWGSMVFEANGFVQVAATSSTTGHKRVRLTHLSPAGTEVGQTGSASLNDDSASTSTMATVPVEYMTTTAHGATTFQISLTLELGSDGDVLSQRRYIAIKKWRMS